MSTTPCTTRRGSFGRAAGPRALVAALAATLALSSPLSAAAKELSLASPIPPGHRFSPAFFNAFAERLKERSGGKLTVKVYAGGSLNPSVQRQYSILLDGVADIAFVAPIYTVDIMPVTSTVSVPGVCRDAVDCTKALWRAYPLIEKEFDAKILALWTNNAPVVITKNKPVRSAADLKGMKVRISGALEAPFWQALGAAPVSQPVTEINQNLANGVIDAIAIDPASIISFKLNDVGRYVTRGVPAQGIAFALAMNKKVYASLSPEERRWVDQSGGETFSIEGAARSAEVDDKAFEVSRKAGIEIIDLPDAEVRKMQAAIAAEVAKFRATKFRSGVTGAQAYDLMKGK